jgi:hypothetical protein
MQIMWCWRCKQEMPMLDEAEYAGIARLYKESMLATKEFRRTWGIPLEHASIHERFAPVRTEYERITGVKEPNENAIMHHRISLYGPPCNQCRKPLRTPKAKLCGACMHPVDVSAENLSAAREYLHKAVCSLKRKSKV